MNVKVLVENTSLSPAYRCEHGLSLYIKTRNHRILFDMGQSSLFLENAEGMDADIGAVDMAILSHGHYDHGGGIETFLKHNTRANLYVHADAFQPHYAKREDGRIDDIGLDLAAAANPRVQTSRHMLRLDDEICVFSGVVPHRLFPPANRVLLRKSSDYEPDDFTHEQNLIVTEDGEDVLFTGCAHNGIVNIIEAARSRKAGRRERGRRIPPVSGRERLRQRYGVRRSGGRALGVRCRILHRPLHRGGWLPPAAGETGPQGISFIHRTGIQYLKEEKRMRIAVPSSGRNICGHFGHCENFNIFDTKDGRIVAENSVPNPGHKPGFLPNFLADMHVTTILAGGMGDGAVQIFNERNVEVVVGASGDARAAVVRYLKGELKSTAHLPYEMEGRKCQ